MTRRARSVNGPVTFVGALMAGRAGGTRTHRRRRRHARAPLLGAGKKTLRAADAAAKNLSEISRKVAGESKRRRTALRKAGKRLERFSATATNVGALLGIAAAGAELVGALRGRRTDRRDPGVARAGTNGAQRAHKKQEEVLEDAR